MTYGKKKKTQKMQRKQQFKRRMSIEVRRQEKLDLAEKKAYRRGEFLGKYTAKMLYGQGDGNFEEEYLRKLKRNW